MFFVDADFAEEVSKHVWCGGRYLKATIGGKSIMLHRFIYQLAHGSAPKIVDHINRNRYDCRSSNLREADHRLSNRNRAHRRGTSGMPPGVGFHPDARSRPYQAMVRRARKTVHLGYFESPEFASLAVANFKLNEAY
jgi:hypothetical protein